LPAHKAANPGDRQFGGRRDWTAPQFSVYKVCYKQA